MSDRPFFIGCATIFVLCSVVLTIAFFPGVPAFPLCEREDCTVHGWLSALSGWAGLLAAAVAIVFTRGQLLEQKKQTAFLLGDADPTIENQARARSGRGPGYRIINWNRRTVFIESINLHSQSGFIRPTLIERHETQKPYPVPGGWYKHSENGQLDRTPKINGWIDRQDRPCVMDLSFRWTDVDKEPPQHGEFPGDITVSVTMYFADSKNRFSIETAMPLREFIPH